jgi:GT2 family glycosyltransferase
MSRLAPLVSVVIPTCGRPESIRRALDALDGQDWPTEEMEILVAADGPDALPLAAPSPSAARFPTRLVRLRRQAGAAAARNAGAAAARGRILLFLDDDVEASRGLVAAHAAAHEQSAGIAVVGYLAPDVGGAGGFFAIALRAWWESMFDAMRAPGHRFGYRDVLTGNLSLPTELFRSIGGFDEALACHEDYELGVRIVGKGAGLLFEPRAAAVHHEQTTLKRALERKRAEGIADVQLARRHPHLLPTLPLGWFDTHASRRQRWLRALAFSAPGAARAAARLLHRSLTLLEAGRLRGRWQRVLDDLLTYHYWIGVRAVVPGRAQLDEFLASRAAVPAPSRSVLTIDLAVSPLDAAIRSVDEVRPDGLTVRWRGEFAGEIPVRPGFERLRGEHLRQALAGDLALPLLDVLGRQGDAGLHQEGGALFTTSVPRAKLAFGPRQSAEPS